MIFVVWLHFDTCTCTSHASYFHGNEWNSKFFLFLVINSSISINRLFEEGLKIYGKGDWKSIARHVSTKNNTQIASHAQKYFFRLEKIHAQQNVTYSFGPSKASTSKDAPMSPIASATHLPMQSDAFPIHPSYFAYPSNKFHHWRHRRNFLFHLLLLYNMP